MCEIKKVMLVSLWERRRLATTFLAHLFLGAPTSLVDEPHMHASGRFVFQDTQLPSDDRVKPP